MGQTENRDYSTIYILLITLVLLIIMWNRHDWDSSPISEDEFKPITQLPDFSAYQTIAQKKHAFFEFFRPAIQKENQKILFDRALLESLRKNMNIETHHGSSNLKKLNKLAARYYYQIKNLQEALVELDKRIDIIPESLVLAQAAKESAWGTSRFAKKANNLFGQWCYSKGCGLVPKKRASGANHEVRKFQTPQASIRSYMRNLNSHSAYAEFREKRKALRENNQAITGKKLAHGLENYSQRRGKYVQEIINLITNNDLE